MSLADTITEMHARRVPLIKAHLISRDGAMSSNAITSPDDVGQLFTKAGAIEPPYDPEILLRLLENSSHLRQVIDAVVVNVDGFPHTFEPILDLGADDIDEQIANALYFEALRQWEIEHPGSSVLPPRKLLWPDDAKVQEQKEQIADEMRLERSRLDNFFDYCTTGYSFQQLRRMTRFDVESTGNGYWEVLRNHDTRRNPLGEIVKFVHVPATTVRLMPEDEAHTFIDERVRQGALSFDTRPVPVKYRRFVQLFNQFRIFYKSFGDQRVWAKHTGIEAKRDSAGRVDMPRNDGPATELIHFKIHSSRTAYGIPRHVGALLELLGAWQAAEVNYLFFDNKSVPPLVVVCKNGSMSEDSSKQLKDFVKNEVKGRGNFHDIMVLTVDAVENGGPTDIDFKPLNQLIPQDALFQNYDQLAGRKARMAYRLPPLLVGDSTDYNRATADTSLYMAESQVFAPEREEFDFLLNRVVLVDMGIKWWRFKSRGPLLRDPLNLAPVVTTAVSTGILVPEEGREEFEQILGRKLKKIDGDWAQQPLPLSQAHAQNLGNILGEGLGLDAAINPRSATRGKPPGGASSTSAPPAAPAQPQLTLNLGAPPLVDERIRTANARLAAARQLLALRDVLLEEEAEQARVQFLETKLAERPPAPPAKPRKKPAKKP